MSNSKWKTTTATAKALGCHPDTLYRLRDRGVLRSKIHYRRIPGKRPTYRWNLEKIEKTMM